MAFSKKVVSYPTPTSAKMADAAEDGSGDYVHISWRSPAIRGLQSDCRYVNNNEQITCRSHARALVRTAEMELPLVKRTAEPPRIQRVIADVARDLGYESLTTEQTDAIFGSMCPSCDIVQSSPRNMQIVSRPIFRGVSHYCGSWGWIRD